MTGEKYIGRDVQRSSHRVLFREDVRSAGKIRDQQPCMQATYFAALLIRQTRRTNNEPGLREQWPVLQLSRVLRAEGSRDEFAFEEYLRLGFRVPS